MSTETRLLIEKEVRELLETAYNNAKTILTTHHKEHHALANALLEHETLTGSQIMAFLDRVKYDHQQKLVSTQITSQSNPVPPSGSTASASAAAAARATAAAVTAAAKGKGIAPVGP